MKTLQISSDYYNTPVYEHLFNTLQRAIDLNVIVPLSENKGYSVIETDVPFNISPLYWGRNRSFGVQINSSKYAKIIVENRYLEGINLVHAHFVMTDGSIALKIHRRTGIPYVS